MIIRITVIGNILAVVVTIAVAMTSISSIVSITIVIYSYGILNRTS